MKKIIVAVLFVFSIAQSARAEWIIFHNGTDGDEYYYNTDKIKYDGKKVKVWCQVDSVGEEPKKYYVEINCDESQFRLSDVKGAWRSIAPDSATEKLEKNLCGRYQITSAPSKPEETPSATSYRTPSATSSATSP